jgi:lipopolysaccharide transport system ATP-binding protein
MSVVIKVENLSKQYRLGLVNSGTMRDDFSRWWSAIRGKEDPLLKVGEVNDRSKAGESDYVWALKDINFEVKKGEILGIIGRNGAGKSTLLKLLSRVTAPTTGSIKSKGKIASLLEVGTGFHPELTGKENIYLNGAILGMRKSEITKKISQIVEFAGIERYVDTPVKRYSSGMYVRLAFAVAAHLEPDILIVDEVLAVGDVEFQKKCLGKMKDVSGQGRTVLFVSHNMASVKNLCTRGVLMENGGISKVGEIDEIVSSYLNRNLVDESVARIKYDQIKQLQEGVIKSPPTFKIQEIKIQDEKGAVKKQFFSGDEIVVSITIEAMQKIMDCRVIVEIVDDSGTSIIASQTCDSESCLAHFEKNKMEKGVYEFLCSFPKNLFSEKKYFLSVQVINIKNEHVNLSKFMNFDVQFLGYNNIQYGRLQHSYLRPKLGWEVRGV